MISFIYRCKIKSVFLDVQQLFKALLKVLPKDTPLTPNTTLWEVFTNMDKNYLSYIQTLSKIELKAEYGTIVELRAELADFKNGLNL